jgi:hypothetical protein
VKAQELRGENFWASGYFVSTVRLDEEMVKRYISEQEKYHDVLGVCLPPVWSNGSRMSEGYD